MTYVIATNRKWYEQLSVNLSKLLGKHFVLINSKEQLTVESLAEIKPRYIFLPHWSYIVPATIYENYESVVFHMTDLPFGRGGSPLQNLISRGIYETKITALRCVKEVDAGPVYSKHSLSLFGTAEEIYLRAAKIIEKMIESIVNNEPEPISQQGDVVSFLRRKPQESNIEGLTKLEELFDYIRMLDADGYPRAYLETAQFRFEFERASLKEGKIISDVVITKKEANEKNTCNRGAS